MMSRHLYFLLCAVAAIGSALCHYEDHNGWRNVIAKPRYWSERIYRLKDDHDGPGVDWRTSIGANTAQLEKIYVPKFIRPNWVMYGIEHKRPIIGIDDRDDILTSRRRPSLDRYDDRNNRNDEMIGPLDDRDDRNNWNEYMRSGLGKLNDRNNRNDERRSSQLDDRNNRNDEIQSGVDELDDRNNWNEYMRSGLGKLDDRNNRNDERRSSLGRLDDRNNMNDEIRSGVGGLDDRNNWKEYMRSGLGRNNRRDNSPL